MPRRSMITSLMAVALIATALSAAGCKKEEKAQEPVPPAKEAAAPAQQAAAPAGPAVAAYRFENSIEGWAGTESGVKTEQTSEQKHNEKRSLRISGTSSSGHWNFAASPKFNLEAGKKYRVSGWMYVDSWSNDKFPPMIKVSISKDNKWDSNVFTKKYDLKNSKGWQHLSTPFVAPQGGALTGYVALEKATQEPISGVVYLDDVKVEAAQ